MRPIIKKLTETFSPSGYEKAIRDIICDEVKPLADEVRMDALGNLIARKGKAGKNGKKIMLAAHMDEIGLIATHVDEKGFVRFTTIGGVRSSTLLGGRVRFVKGTPGIIGAENITDAGKTLQLDQLFIDVGASSRKDCPVSIGDVAAFERPFIEMGRRLVAKSMDDRIGCAILIETMRAIETSTHEIHFVFCSQEEVGLRGSTTSAYEIDPDIGLAVDVTGVGDTPKASRMAVSLGYGPAIKVKDAGMIADARIVEWMVRTAEKNRIPFQREVLDGGTTDARSIQLTRAGVPAGCLSVPCRYIHSPSEMVDYDDVQNAVRLMTALVNSPFET